ncbi:hypothetical protein AB0L82_35675 [Nocardia sp. NPDC052001]|uniref:hypothetical protein n=1 Tax=Nocardia sp. NPDC052001 TaxID=3154853 RepID=UPI003443F378
MFSKTLVGLDTMLSPEPAPSDIPTHSPSSGGRSPGRRSAIRAIAATTVVCIALLFGAAAASSEATAAPTSCSNLATRVATHNSNVAKYDSEVAALNKAGGGTPGQVAYYNGQKLYLNNESATLNTEQTQCTASVSWTTISGIIREARQGRGDFGVGTGTAAEADAAGRAWVGDGAKLSSDGKAIVSADRLKTYRPPTFKKNLGKTQANYQWRLTPTGEMLGNGHLDVIGG